MFVWGPQQHSAWPSGEPHCAMPSTSLSSVAAPAATTLFDQPRPHMDMAPLFGLAACSGSSSALPAGEENQVPPTAKLAEAFGPAPYATQHHQNYAPFQQNPQLLQQPLSTLPYQPLYPPRAAQAPHYADLLTLLNNQQQQQRGVPVRLVGTPAVPVLAEEPCLDSSISSDVQELAPLLPPAHEPQKRREVLRAEAVDIDSMDATDPIFCAGFALEAHDIMRAREHELALDHTYLTRHAELAAAAGKREVNARARALLVNWIMEICHKFKLVSETLYLSVNLVDRYLSVRECPRDELQLLAVTALFVAAKFEEVVPPVLDDFVYISADRYTAAQIVDFERALLRAVEWRLTAPCPLQFLRRYSKAAGCDAALHTMGKYLLERALLSYAMLCYAPSLQAAAAVYLAHVLLHRCAPQWTPQMQYHSAYVEHEVMPCALALCALLADDDPKLRFVYHKYGGSRRGTVAYICATEHADATQRLTAHRLA